MKNKVDVTVQKQMGGDLDLSESSASGESLEKHSSEEEQKKEESIRFIVPEDEPMIADEIVLRN